MNKQKTFWLISAIIVLSVLNKPNFLNAMFPGTENIAVIYAQRVGVKHTSIMKDWLRKWR